MINLTAGPTGVGVRPLRIVLPGGSGQVDRLWRGTCSNRTSLTVLTRGPYTAPWQTVHWDGENEGPWTETLEGADVCINLAGRSVNCRYTADNRAAIYDSRIGTTRLLNRVIGALAEPPRVWLNASTATIYRHAMDRAMDELRANWADTSSYRSDDMRRRHGTFPFRWRRIGRLSSFARRHADAQGGSAQRHYFQPYAGKCVCDSTQSGAVLAWGENKQWAPVCELDSRG